MAEFRCIRFELYSQFGAERIPELRPLPQEHYMSQGIVRAVPKLVDETSSIRSVYIPVLPGSVFWISYAVSPPVPDGHYFLFKLYINGTHIVSWSTGKEEEWKGRTMFALYERPEDEDGRRRVEKRVLSFTPPDKKSKEWEDVKDPYEDKTRMEIKVHRAHGRARIEREREEYSKTEHAQDAKGIHLVNAGRASSDHPKRFYKFALIDPVDQPFATFRYYYRTWEQLEDMGLLAQDWRSQGEKTDIPVIEPYEATARDAGSSRASRNGADDVFYECADGTADARSPTTPSSTASQPKSPTKRASWRSALITKRPSSVATSQDSRCASEPLHAYVPRGAPGARRDTPDPTQQRRSITRTPPRSYRLSVPPSITLLPPDDASRPLPSLPQKSDSQSSIAYRPHPAYPVEDWRTRTPSPVRSIREGIRTPPLERRKESRASSLMNAITSTWKRRGTPSSERRREADGRDGARSASGEQK